MLPASNRGAGTNVGFPDVCNTIVGPATVPLPYPNIGMNAQAAPFSSTVMLSMMSALNMRSRIPMTSGDEAGTAHPTIKGGGAYTMGNPVVFVEYTPAINLLCPTTGNNMNNPLGAVLVPSVTNVLFTLLSGEASGDDTLSDQAERELSRDELTRLEEYAKGGALGPVEPAIVLEGGIGLVVIRRFTFETPTLVHAAMTALTTQGVEKVMFDVRDNPGGDLIAAARTAELFLEKGALVVQIVDAEGDGRWIRAQKDKPFTQEVAILVGPGTASAAEVFAVALVENGRARTFGGPSTGKGTVQRVVDGGSELARTVTVASCTGPSGRPIHGRGVPVGGGGREEEAVERACEWFRVGPPAASLARARVE